MHSQSFRETDPAFSDAFRMQCFGVRYILASLLNFMEVAIHKNRVLAVFSDGIKLNRDAPG